MFNIVQVKGDDAGGYYGGQENYYLGGNARSRWVGQGAAGIGLSGPVDAKAFTQLMNGEVPYPGQAPERVLSGVRKGWDMTISAPKWASVLITLGDDKRLAAHWQTAAQRAFDYVERFATYRKTTKGRTVDMVGAKLIGGAFLHDANRNNEPSIHVHMVASAIGVTPEEKLRAVDLQHAYKHAKLIGQYVHASFAHTVRRDGYQVGLDDNGMATLENAPKGLDDVSEALSTRRDEVRSEIDRLGVGSRQGEVAVVRATRDAKSGDTDLLIDQARAIAEAKGFGPDQIRALVPDTRLPLKDAMKQSVDGTLPKFVSDRLEAKSDQQRVSSPSDKDVLEPWSVRNFLTRTGTMLAQFWNMLTDQKNGGIDARSGRFASPTLADAEQSRDIFQPPSDYPVERLAARHELAYQIRRVSERQAAFTLHEVTLPTLISGLNDGLPGVDNEQVIAAARDLVSEGLLSVGRDRKSLYSATGLELERENRIYAQTQVGKGKANPILSPKAAERAINRFENDRHPLSEGQRNLVAAIVSSKDAFISVQGIAGTGKTTAIRAAKSILDQDKSSGSGIRLYGVANTKSARDEMKAQGIEARTTASFLSRFTRYFHTGIFPVGEEKQTWQNTVLLFDEASFAGNADMEAAMAVADKLGVRGFVSQGDRDQLPAIPAGNVPDLIAKLNNGFTVTLSDIVRQTNPDLRAAIESLVGVQATDAKRSQYAPITGARDVRTRVSNAVSHWAKSDAITDLGLDKATGREGRAGQLLDIATTVANEWQSLNSEERANTLVVFPTHELRGLFHREVRQTLRDEGQIKGDDKELSILRPKPLGQAEKDRGSNYVKGDVLVFSQRVSRIDARPGSRYTVASTDRERNQLELVDVKGDRHTFDLTDGEKLLPRFEVFRPAKEVFAEGDRIRILPGDPRNLAEGLTDLTITKVNGRGLEVIGRETNPRENETEQSKTVLLKAGSSTSMMIDHDYSRTVYAAQGLSSLRVLAGFHSQSIMTSFANLYVIGSRAREALSIITDSLERAIEAVAHNPGIQMSAHTAMDHLDIEHFIDRSRSEIENARALATPDVEEVAKSPERDDTSMATETPVNLEREQTIDVEDIGAPEIVPEREVGD